SPGTTAVLEVDEAVLPWAVETLTPRMAVLLNLSRDQLDRLHEVRRVAGLWRRALVQVPTVVTNAADPLLVWAAASAGNVHWVDTGLFWTDDASACPACGRRIRFGPRPWSCACGLRQPVALTVLHDDGTLSGDGWQVLLDLPLPGRTNRSNAALAVAAAMEMGVAPTTAVTAFAGVREVGGRFFHREIDGHSVRLILAKNPAGWAHALEIIDAPAVVVALNAQIQDGFDPSWIWDVPFEVLGNRQVVASGERFADLRVRLAYAGIDAVGIPDLRDAIRSLPSGRVDLVANYSAFMSAQRMLAGDG
ncbi:MAG: DUF1727 domain-containing protein, partial [Acidimicrobiia bacterium]